MIADVPLSPTEDAGLWQAARNRRISLLVVGQTVSALGDWILPISVAIELVTSHRPLTDLALVMGSRTLATGLTVLYGGILADRLRRTRLMIFADVLRALSVAAILAVWSSLPVAGLCTAMFVFGIGEALFRPAYSALIPRIVKPDYLKSANVLNTASQRLAVVIGPAIAGILYSLTGGRVSLSIDIATFAVSALTLVNISEKRTGPETRSRRVRLSDARIGAVEMWRRDWLRWLTVGGIVQILFFIAPWFVFLPVVTASRYGGGSAYAICLSCFGIGAIIGGISAGRIRTSQPGIPAILGVGLLALIMVGLAVPVPLWVLAAFHFIGGFGIDMCGVLVTVAEQRDVPDEVLGRVMSFDLLISKVTTPVAYALIGPVAGHIGKEPILIAGALACVLPMWPLLLLKSVRALSSPSSPIQSEVSGAGAGLDVPSELP